MTRSFAELPWKLSHLAGRVVLNRAAVVYVHDGRPPHDKTHPLPQAAFKQEEVNPKFTTIRFVAQVPGGLAAIVVPAPLDEVIDWLESDR